MLGARSERAIGPCAGVFGPTPERAAPIALDREFTDCLRRIHPPLRLSLAQPRSSRGLDPLSHNHSQALRLRRAGFTLTTTRSHPHTMSDSENDLLSALEAHGRAFLASFELPVAPDAGASTKKDNKRDRKRKRAQADEGDEEEEEWEEWGLGFQCG